MSITTRTGDKGKTSVYRGKRVSKDNIRIEICGMLDELGVCLGLAKALVKKDKKIKGIIESIQKDLFMVAGEIVCQAKFIKQLKKRINQKKVENLDKISGGLEKSGKFNSKSFSLPGKNFTSAVFDLARVAARRAEREIVTFKRKKALKNNYILVYLNRLSDLLYLLARKYEVSSK